MFQKPSTFQGIPLLSALLLSLALNAAAMLPQLHADEEVTEHIVIEGSHEEVSPTERSADEIQHDLRLTPGGATFVDAEEFLLRKVSHLSDALRYVQGFGRKVEQEPIPYLFPYADQISMTKPLISMALKWCKMDYQLLPQMGIPKHNS